MISRINQEFGKIWIFEAMRLQGSVKFFEDAVILGLGVKGSGFNSRE